LARPTISSSALERPRLSAVDSYELGAESADARRCAEFRAGGRDLAAGRCAGLPGDRLYRHRPLAAANQPIGHLVAGDDRGDRAHRGVGPHETGEALHAGVPSVHEVGVLRRVLHDLRAGLPQPFEPGVLDRADELDHREGLVAAGGMLRG